MALKKFNPTSPGRRHMTHLTFDEITKSTPERSLTEPLKKTGGRDSRGRISVRFIGGGHKQRYRPWTSSATSPPRSRPSSTTPNCSAAGPPALHDGRSAISSGPRGWRWGDGGGGRGGGHPPGNCLSLKTSCRHHDPQHRASAKGGQMVRSAGAPPSAWPKGRRPEAAPGRGAHGGFECGPPSARSATSTTRTCPSAGGRTAGSYRVPQPRFDEPCGPPARRRRGQDSGLPGDAVGRRPRATRRGTTSAPRSSSSRGGSKHGRSLKKGLIDAHLLKKIER